MLRKNKILFAKIVDVFFQNAKNFVFGGKGVADYVPPLALRENNM